LKIFTPKNSFSKIIERIIFALRILEIQKETDSKKQEPVLGLILSQAFKYKYLNK